MWVLLSVKGTQAVVSLELCGAAPQGRGQVKSRTCTGPEADMGSLVPPTRATTQVPSPTAK